LSTRATGAPRTLVLNSGYEVVGTISTRRALRLLLTAKAEVVVADGELRSATASYPLAVVVRLHRYVKVDWKPVPLTKRSVWARDRGVCQYCGQWGDTLDHVVPRSRGGQHSWGNVVLACRRCNNRKGSQTLNELGWELRRTPTAPVRRAALLPVLHASWAPYVDSGSGAA
jgi:5-methylcytosine-specific restriction endonuclease McrA